jgi:RNA polymerase sigma-70 factor (ECF subfamily)
MSTVKVLHVANEPLTQDFDRIFREHSLMVYRAAYSVTGNPQDAHDILQNVFLWLLRRGKPSNFRDTKAYLYRAAINASLNLVKSRRREVSSDDAEQPAPFINATLGVEALGIQGRLLDALAQLHPRWVEMLVLRYEQDYTDHEIAKLLGTSRAVVAVTLHRARSRLKILLRASSGDKK